MTYFNSILLTKPQPLPPQLFCKYYGTTEGCNEIRYKYNMIDTKTGNYLGTMEGGPVVYNDKDKMFYPQRKPYKSFYISYLNSTEEGFGHGRQFIELAKKESKKYNCGGRVHLIASRVYSPQSPPHLFYRKCGFTSNFEKINKYMDKCILLSRKMDWTKANNLPMYLPVSKETKSKIPKLTGIIKFIKKFL